MMKVELSLYASNLKNVAGAFRGTSDPFAVVTHMATQPGGKAVVLGQTETIQNTVSPEWVKVFVLDYELGTPMKLIVSIFDQVKKGDNKSMGSAVFDVDELLGVRGNVKAKRVKAGGTIFAHVRKAPETNAGVLRLQLGAANLKNTEGFMRKSDPFFELSRRVDAAATAVAWDNVYRSNVCQDTLNPVWDAAVLELGLLCGDGTNNLDAPLKVCVYDFEGSGKHVLMGQLETSVNGLVQAAVGNSNMDLTVKGQKTGELTIARAEVSVPENNNNVTEQMAAVSVKEIVPAVQTPKAAGAVTSKPSFIDYIAGGCRLNCIVAIDFTGSNGDPRKPGTLHHVDDNSNNPYEKAVAAIVSILAQYDTDQKFPVLGFGAKYSGVVQHCFQVGATEEAHGVDGVLDAYRSVFKTGLIMSSPTVFTEVMETAAARATSALDAARKQQQLAYTILLIVTDGAVSDVSATAACLKQMSDTPLSIVIVGVGDADFSSMQFLDDLPDMKRDLVQFVEFNKHQPAKNDLTKVTLREIPDQLTSYFASKGIPPGKAIVVTEEKDIVVADQEEEIDLSLDFGEEEIVVSGGGVNTKDNW
jgi:Copine/C2 domain